jgi:hypothetical protein
MVYSGQPSNMRIYEWVIGASTNEVKISKELKVECCIEANPDGSESECLPCLAHSGFSLNF